MSVQGVQARSRAAVAGDVSAGNMKFQFEDIDPITAVQVSVRAAAGTFKAWDGAVTIAGKIVTVDNTGVTDFIATDVVSVFAAHG